MKLYFMPRTRAVRPRWLLEELGCPYELVRLDAAAEEHNAPAFLAVNPLGEVPVLVDGEVTLTESLAILLHLGDRPGPARFSPPPDAPSRGDYLQWLVFAETRVDPVVVGLYELARRPAGEAVGAEQAATLRARLEVVFDVVEARLQDRDVLAGDAFTAADVSLASILHLANGLGLLAGRPRLRAYMMAHCGRPAVIRAVRG